MELQQVGSSCGYAYLVEYYPYNVGRPGRRQDYRVADNGGINIPINVV